MMDLPNHNALENVDAGGQLHSILRCNLQLSGQSHDTEKKPRLHTKHEGHDVSDMPILSGGHCQVWMLHPAWHKARRSPQNAANSNATCTFDQTIGITEPEYSEVMQELADVRKSTRQARGTQPGSMKETSRAAICVVEAIKGVNVTECCEWPDSKSDQVHDFHW